MTGTPSQPGVLRICGDQLEAAHVRQHHVHDDHRRPRVRCEQRLRAEAVGRVVHGVAALASAGARRAGTTTGSSSTTKTSRELGGATLGVTAGCDADDEVKSTEGSIDVRPEILEGGREGSGVHCLAHALARLRWARQPETREAVGRSASGFAWRRCASAKRTTSRSAQ